MAKVLAIHEITLHPGVDPAEFEQFMAEATLPELAGVHFHFLKGERGARAGQYAYLIEFDSEERRDALFPVAGAATATSDEVAQALGSEATMRLMDRWGSLGSTPGAPGVVYTDYRVVDA